MRYEKPVVTSILKYFTLEMINSQINGSHLILIAMVNGYTEATYIVKEVLKGEIARPTNNPKGIKKVV
jgi:hypothetical protein